MTFKRMLKFAFAFLLVGGGLVAYAQGDKVVTLADKVTTVTWAEFVKALNNPSTVPVPEGTLSADAKEAKALEAAKTKTAAARKATEDAKAITAEKQTAVTQANDNIKTAQNNVNTLTAAVATPKKAYDDKQDELTNWNAQITTLNNKISGFEGDLKPWQAKKAAQEDKISTANQDILRYQAAIGNMEKTTETTTTTTVKSWLKTINDAANYILNKWTAKEYTEKLYYRIHTTEDFDESFDTLILSFVSPATTDGWTNGSLTELMAFVKGKTITALQVYMGSDYAALNGNIETLNVKPYPATRLQIIPDAVDAVNTLTAQAKYLDTNTTSTTKYKDEGKKAEYDGLIAKCEQDIKNATAAIVPFQEEIDIINGKIDDANKSKTTYNEKIIAYTVTLGEGGVTEQTRLKNAYNDALAAVEAAKAEVESAKTALTTAQAELNTATTAENSAVAAEATAEAAQTTAQAAYDKAALDVVLANYKNVKLTGDVLADTPIDSYDGIIDGQDHIINLGTATTVFGALTGTVNNVGVNGQIANNHVGARMSKVAYWVGNAGAYYNNKGEVTENITNIGEYGFKVRDFYGVDFSSKQLVNKSDKSKIVYSISVYDINNTVTQKYVQNNNGVLNGVDMVTYAIPANRFAKSETYDLKGVANVFYADNTCDQVEITDDKKSFYCPVEISAKSVNYNRAFVAGRNAVCLPFELNSDIKGVQSLATYDSETAEKFFFTKKLGSIAAYTPILLSAANEFSLTALENVVIKPTPAEMIVCDEGNLEDPSKSYGLLKAATRDEIAGASKAHLVFGLSKDGSTFVRLKEGANFPALRMIVFSGMNADTNTTRSGEEVSLDEKEIVIVDEDKTTVVNEVASSKLTVVGGRGEIVITSNADCGNVDIYNMEGRLVTKAEVVAGTTNVEVPAGLYIVMGKKVMVK